jgi:magnesium transporter
MASVRLPVPSLGLLRFLRSQSENLSFFSANHGPAQSLGLAPSKALCATRKQSKAPSRTGHALLSREDTQLQSGLFDLGRLLPSQAQRTSKSPRTRQTTLFASGLGVRYRSTNQDSDSCTPTWQERLWGTAKRKAPEELKPDDLPDSDGDGHNNSMFNTRRQRSQLAELEPRLRCTEVDENGVPILVDGEFKKSELIARVS